MQNKVLRVYLPIELSTVTKLMSYLCPSHTNYIHYRYEHPGLRIITKNKQIKYGIAVYGEGQQTLFPMRLK